MKKYISLDIGGTSIKHGLLDERGNILLKGTTPSAAKIAGGTAQRAVQVVKGYLQEHKAAGVAVSSPGLIDPAAGKVIFAGDNFTDYGGTELKKIVETECGLPCEVINDANAAAFAEYSFGAGCGAKSMYFVIVGTGVGGAFIYNGEVVAGSGFAAGEIGFMPTAEGKRFEELASTAAALGFYREKTKTADSAIDGEMLFCAAQEGDKTAKTALLRMAKYLAAGLANISCVVNPEIIVLGGGIMSRADYFRPLINREYRALLPEFFTQNTRLEFAKLKNDAGMIGALAYFLSKRCAEGA